LPLQRTLAEAIIDIIRRETATVLHDPNLPFARKLPAVPLAIGRRFGFVTPKFMHDLQRFAPACNQGLREMREQNGADRVRKSEAEQWKRR
jgi:hypothetical protein